MLEVLTKNAIFNNVDFLATDRSDINHCAACRISSEYTSPTTGSFLELDPSPRTEFQGVECLKINMKSNSVKKTSKKTK